MKHCGDEESHRSHIWTDERIVRDDQASIEAGEPVGREVITREYCWGTREGES